MKLKKLWKSGEKLAALERMAIFAMAGIYLSLVMLLENKILFPVLFMNVVFWALVAYDLWFVFTESKLEKQINKDLAFRGYVATVQGVSTINLHTNMKYLDFLIGTTHYEWYSVPGKYLMVEIEVTERHTFYVYHLLGKDSSLIAVADNKVPAHRGGVQVFSQV